MKRDLKTLVADLKSARGSQLLLLFGDGLQVQEACATVLDLLVPPEQRGFNFERYDGRSASWEQVEASLMTPPFLPGKKLVWVENAPYFFSREQKGELGEKILELWQDSKKDEAAKLLIDLLVLEGWTQEQWERLDQASSRALLKLLEGDSAERREDADELLAYCKGRNPELTRRKGSDDHRLLHLLEQGLPEWGFLLLTAVQVDRRTRLYKRLEESGAAIFLGLERDRYGKISREGLLEFVSRRLGQAHKTLEPQARELIVARAGDDLRSLGQELDKLLLFVGDHPAIRAADVEAIVADQGEGWIFDLTRAIGDRDARAALAQLARLLAHGEHPLKILGTVAAEVRRLLAARQLLGTELAQRWQRGMTYQQFQRTVLKDGAPLLTRNPYADYMCFQRAERFSLRELDAYMEEIFEADLQLKSSRSQPRLVIEKLLLGMCLKARGGQPTGQAAT
ncbi:MAG TPA: DNA polymerase III subunit delta [Verrucomicrobiae bacterium]|nr:DNA polymerase III subunit delta [Verrucomicrobiae bacterium]